MSDLVTWFGPVTAHDRLAAYRLIIAHLPRQPLWTTAICVRKDGSTAPGVFAVVDELRMELHVRIGDLYEKLTHEASDSTL